MLLFIPTLALSQGQTHERDGFRLRSWDGTIHFDIVNMAHFEGLTFKPGRAIDTRSDEVMELWEVVLSRPDLYDPSRGPVSQSPRTIYTDDDGLQEVIKFTAGMSGTLLQSESDEEEGK